MSRLDIIIFGATGFSGKHAAMELCRIAKNYPGLTWGVAGRSRDKLEEILKEISENINEDLSAVKVIVADAKDEKSLKEMCSQCKVLVNCCGPYRHYGEPVVKAAIEEKSHYVDISAEPQFIERMHAEYAARARAAGARVVLACGFGSVPTDLGVVFLEQNFDGTLNSVESYLKTNALNKLGRSGVINHGTWDSLIHAMSHFRELLALRRISYPEPLPKFEPELKTRLTLHRKDNDWSFLFPIADAMIVERTQRQLYETTHKRPVQMQTYIKFPNLFLGILALFSIVILFLMTLCCTRKLLLMFPWLFSCGLVSKHGPSEDMMNKTKFTFELYGEGWKTGSDMSKPPDKKMMATVSGVNPGYGATVVALLYSAITILTETEKIPAGGVLTTGIAFRNTNIIKHLNENNLKFEIVHNKVK